MKVRVKFLDGTYGEGEIPPGCGERHGKRERATVYVGDRCYQARKHVKNSVWFIYKIVH